MNKKKKTSMKKTSSKNKEENKSENTKPAYPGAGKIYRNIEESKKH